MFGGEGASQPNDLFDPMRSSGRTIWNFQHEVSFFSLARCFIGEKYELRAAAVLKTRGFINLHNTAAANIPEAEELDKAWEFEYPARPEPYDETELPPGLSA